MSSNDLMKGALVGAIAASVVMISATAMAGTGIGAVFNLGKTNKVNAQSTLSGKTSGKNLQLTNTGSGSGLGIRVAAGKHPIVVNAGAGKATNLNADKLDGHDASYFASKGYSTSFSTSVILTSAGESHQLMSVSVPIGHYIVLARLQGITGNDGGGNDFRYDCDLAGTAAVIDDPIYRVGETNQQENYLTTRGHTPVPGRSP
jgi:hypothetical protein